MTLIIGMVVIIVGLIVYVGQSLSFFAPNLATRIGLNDPAGDMDPSLYVIETKANGLSDILLTWTFPASGLLMILDNSAWPLLALFGGGIYLYFALLTIFCRLFLKKAGKKVGTPASEKTAYVFSFIWIICSITMVALAVQVLT